MNLVKLNDHNIAPSIGHRFRIEKGGDIHEGEVVGLGEATVVNAKKEACRTWKLKTEADVIEFVPSDWKVSAL